MIKQKTVSVAIIIPAYNVERYLKETLDSVAKQTFKRFIAVIVDDGSSDGTHSVAQKYAENDSRFKVVQKKNGGVSSARNLGLEHINGADYHTFIDGDDVIASDYLEQLVLAAQEYSADIVSSWIEPTSKSPRLNQVTREVSFSVKRDEDAVLDFLYNKSIQNSACAKLFRSKKLLSLRFNESLAVGEDMEYTFRAFKKADVVAISRSTLYFYIQREGSAMRRGFSPRRVDGYRSAQTMRGYTEVTLKESRALTVKLFTEAFSTLVAMAGSSLQYADLYNEMRQAVKRSALAVTINRAARKPQRAYAAISLVSMPLALRLARMRKEGARRGLGVKRGVQKGGDGLYVKFYDKVNLGDDLFIKILSERYSNSLHTTAKNIKHLSPYINLSFPMLRRNILKVQERVFKVHGLTDVRASSRSEAVLHIGGSIFIEGNDLALWRGERQMYHSLDVPYYVLGSNFGPYKSQTFKHIVKDILSQAEDVCFRDEVSYNTFKELPNARVATDIAFTLRADKFLNIKQERRAVFSVIDAYKKFDAQVAVNYEREIVNLVSKLVEDGYNVTLMAFCEFEGDVDAIRRIMNVMSEAVSQKIDTHIYMGDLDESLTLLAKSDIIVASRFHASILGLLFGKRVLPMAYSDKTINILEDMDFKGPVIDIRKINEFSGLQFNLEKIKINNVADQIELAEKQFYELDKILTKRK